VVAVAVSNENMLERLPLASTQLMTCAVCSVVIGGSTRTASCAPEIKVVAMY